MLSVVIGSPCSLELFAVCVIATACHDEVIFFKIVTIFLFVDFAEEGKPISSRQNTILHLIY